MGVVISTISRFVPVFPKLVSLTVLTFVLSLNKTKICLVCLFLVAATIFNTGKNTHQSFVFCNLHKYSKPDLLTPSAITSSHKTKPQIHMPHVSVSHLQVVLEQPPAPACCRLPLINWLRAPHNCQKEKKKPNHEQQTHAETLPF